jgi:hypothetical protein
MRPTVPPQSTPCRFRFTLSQTRTISAKTCGGPSELISQTITPWGRQRDDGPGRVAVDTTVCRLVVPEPQTTASKMSDTRVCGH